MAEKDYHVTEFNVEGYSKLGDYLKVKREEKGLSIEEVVNIIRIRKHFLQALEEENYEVLPERTYALGYLRSYANFLEIKDANYLVNYLDSVYHFTNPHYSNKDHHNYLDEKYALINTIKENTNNIINQINKPKELEDPKTKNLASPEIKLNINKSLLPGDIKFNNAKIKNEYKTPVKKSNFTTLLLVIIFIAIVGTIVWFGIKFTHSPRELDQRTPPSKETANENEMQSLINKDDFLVLKKDDNVVNQLAPAPNPTSNRLTGNSNSGQNTGSGGNASRAGNSVTSGNNSLNNNSAQANSTVSSNENALRFFKASWPQENKTRDIKLFFSGDVWVQIYNTDERNMYYLDRIFKAGESFEVPGVDKISMIVGNYRSVTMTVDGILIYLNQQRNNNLVVNGIILERDSLLQAYGNNSRY
ncbi:Cytoskeleton protein RodZ domain protein [Candidatus Hepatincolaceae symbiont of Richtersius coronifer]